VARQAVIGLDIGGSTTRAVRSEAGVVVAEAGAGSANIASVGVAEAARQLDAALAAIDTNGVAAVCAGAAGADNAESVEVVRALLVERVPGARVLVVHDAQLLLAAAGTDVGVAVISGTGSSAWGLRADGTHARAGGWGFLLGDEGSGYRVALDAVRHALRLTDRGEPADPISRAIVAACGLSDPEQLIAHVHAIRDRSYWAGLARVVPELAAGGDPAAIAVLDVAADALTDIATTVLRRLDIDGPVVFGGGFVVNQPLLQRAVRDRLPGTDVHILTDPPVRGAVRLAEALLNPDSLERA
jgi:glucosamine kinase